MPKPDTDDAHANIIRKQEHLRINLEEDVQFKGVTSGLDNYYFVHQALPEINADEIDLRTTLLGKQIDFPLIISPMVGGIKEAERINRNLARAAQSAGIAMAVGSQRIAIDAPDMALSYRIRDVAPDVPLFATLGAIQLNYGYDVTHCQQAVDMLDADALILYLNPLQRALQANGKADFSHLLNKIGGICRELSVPVIVKEVGWGISEDVARKLAAAGVAAIDVAGSGGTSWSEVEKYRVNSALTSRIANSFSTWGISTAESIEMVKRGAKGVTIIASGGIRTGVDLAKAIALGAQVGGVGAPLLKLAVTSTEAVEEYLMVLREELRISMFCIGAANLAQLVSSPYLKRKGLT